MTGSVHNLSRPRVGGDDAAALLPIRIVASRCAARTASMWLPPTVLLGALLAGCAGSGPTPSREVPVAGPTVTAKTGTPISAPTDASTPAAALQLDPCPAAAPAARTKLPAVTLRCLVAGPDLPLAQLPARPFVINVWASWCVPCQDEAPRLRAAATVTRGKVDFLGIDTGDGVDAAKYFLDRYGIRYPQLADPDSDTLHRLGIPGIPVTLAVDRTGRIVYRRIGEISTAQLAAAVRAVEADADRPPVARR